MPVKLSSGHLSKHVAIVRIVFGLMWGVDAVFKWQPAFREGFFGQIIAAADGQPAWLHGWFSFWAQLLSHNPRGFVVLVAVVETLIAVALIFGLARRLVYLSAAGFSLLVWSVAEGFGGPYGATSTDIGAGVIYAVVFFSLYGLDRLAPQGKWTLDSYIMKRLPWWSVVANP